MRLIDLFKRFKKSIILALSLVIIEHIAWIVEPTIFGTLIDAVIDKPDNLPIWDLMVLTPLLIWVGVFIINSGVGAFRRSFDQKIYLNIFIQIATEVASHGKEKKLSISLIAGRAELTKEYVEFFQYRVPEIIEQSIAILGAIIALFFFDYRIGIACFTIIAPILYIARLYNNKVLLLQKSLHDNQELAYNAYSSLDIEKIKEYYGIYAKNQQKIANWGAINFGILRVALLIIFLIVLYISIDLDDFSLGNIYSIVAYLWTFVTSSEYLPDLFASLTSLKDLSRRLKTESQLQKTDIYNI